MKIRSSKYKTAEIPEWVLSLVTGDNEEYSDSGFILIDDYFVPYGFIEMLWEELQGGSYDGSVSRVEQMFDPEFWAELTANERQIVGPCLLLLVENGFLVPSLDEDVVCLN